MTKRIEWIDIAKFLCMICVMITHLDCKSQTALVLYSPFYLAIFFFCSGYCYKPAFSFAEMFNKKIRQLLIPWFLFSNVNIIISHIMSIKEHKSISTEIIRNLLQVRNYDERLWFLACLFVSFIPFYFIIKYINSHRNKIDLIMLLISILFMTRIIYKNLIPNDLFRWGTYNLPWHIDYLPTSLMQMTFGYCFKLKYEAIFDRYNVIKNRLLLTFVYLLVILLPFYFNVNMYNLFGRMIDYFSNIFGILFIVSWCKVINTNKYISFIGSNTLFYFCTHNKIETVLEYTSKKILGSIYITINNNELFAFIFSLSIALISSVILIIPTKIVNKYLPWMVGRKKEIN